MATIVYIQEGDVFGDEKRKCCLLCDVTHSFRQMSLRLPTLQLFWHSTLWQPLSIFKKGMYLDMREESAVCRVTLPMHFAKCHLDCPHCRYFDIATFGNHCLYSRRDERRKWCLSCDVTHSFRQMPLTLPTLPLFWHNNFWQPLSIFKKGMYLEMREESAVCRVTLHIHFAKCKSDCPHCRYSDIATFGNHCLYSRWRCIRRWEKKVLFVVWRYPFILPNVT
jgi:hypothetical protein